jgi:hypothetical protein
VKKLINFLTEQVLDSQEGLCPMDLGEKIEVSLRESNA